MGLVHQEGHPPFMREWAKWIGECRLDVSKKMDGIGSNAQWESSGILSIILI